MRCYLQGGSDGPKSDLLAQRMLWATGRGSVADVDNNLEQNPVSRVRSQQSLFRPVGASANDTPVFGGLEQL